MSNSPSILGATTDVSPHAVARVDAQINFAQKLAVQLDIVQRQQETLSDTLDKLAQAVAKALNPDIRTYVFEIPVGETQNWGVNNRGEGFWQIASVMAWPQRGSSGPMLVEIKHDRRPDIVFSVASGELKQSDVGIPIEGTSQNIVSVYGGAGVCNVVLRVTRYG